MREILDAPRTYHVSKLGFDGNSGLDPDCRLRTVARALELADGLDPGRHLVTIEISAPTYPVVWDEPIALTHRLAGRILIRGATGNRLDVILSAAGNNCLSAYYGNVVMVQALTLKPQPGWHGLVGIHGARLFGSNLNFDGPATPGESSHVYATRDGYIELGGPITILGPAGYWLNSSHKGEIRLSAATVAFGNSIPFKTVAYALGKSEIVVTDGSTIAGAATGRRYHADGGWIQWMGGSEFSFPGSLPGQISDGGIYKTA